MGLRYIHVSDRVAQAEVWQVWWHISLISSLQRQVNLYEFQANQRYIVSLRRKKKKRKRRRRKRKRRRSMRPWVWPLTSQKRTKTQKWVASPPFSSLNSYPLVPGLQRPEVSVASLFPSQFYCLDILNWTLEASHIPGDSSQDDWQERSLN